MTAYLDASPLLYLEFPPFGLTVMDVHQMGGPSC